MQSLCFAVCLQNVILAQRFLGSLIIVIFFPNQEMDLNVPLPVNFPVSCTPCGIIPTIIAIARQSVGQMVAWSSRVDAPHICKALPPHIYQMESSYTLALVLGCLHAQLKTLKVPWLGAEEDESDFTRHPGHL